MAIPEYGAYFSISRVTFPLAIAWVIFACHFGYGGVINKFLSARAFIPLTRISYCTYLIHAVIMIAYNFSQESLFHASGLSLVILKIKLLIIFLFLCFIDLLDSWPYYIFIFCCILLYNVFRATVRCIRETCFEPSKTKSWRIKTNLIFLFFYE